MTDSLRHGAAQAEAAWKNRTDDLEREGRGIPSRFADRSSEPNAVIAISQSGHGFILQSVIRNVAGIWEAAVDDDPDADEDLFIVTQVQDADNVLAIAWGLFCADGLADFTPYFLSPTTPGGITATRPTGPDVAGRMVFYHITNDLVIVPGPILGRTHRHALADISDVHLTAPANLDVLLYNSASQTWQNGPITAGSLAPIAGLSVLGRAANTTGVVAAITAATTGDVLRMGASSLSWGQLSTASYADSSVTNAKLDDVVTAAGPFGSSSTVAVVTVNAKGRVTALSTATITAAAIGASATSHTHTLAGLTDVSVASPASGDYLRYNGSAWGKYSLGDLAYDAGAKPYHDRLVLDTTDLGIRNRLLINSSGSLEFIVRGTEGTDDKWAVVAADGTDLSFTDDGNEVLRWTCSATAGNRKFDFKVPIASVNIGLVARMRKNGNQSISANTDTTITTFSALGTPTLTGLNTSTGIFTAPAAGTYVATAAIVGTIASAANHTVQAYISKNASTTDTSGKGYGFNGTGDPFGASAGASVSGVFELAAGDTLRLVGYIFTGTSPTIADAYFSVARII